MHKDIVGRSKEKEILRKILESHEAEFVALYGRRRVGKTYLIRQMFKKPNDYFEATGQKDGNLTTQLENFSKALHEFFPSSIPLQQPKNWKEAFDFLTIKIRERKRQGNFIIFLDELPWMNTKKSHLLQALDYYWNSVWSQMKYIKLIVCGSAASWMLNEFINAKGGLHNRLTRIIHLAPFNLGETKEFLYKRGVRFTSTEILTLFMVMGGIPYYLHHIEKGKSANKNINDLCFKEGALLFGEFRRLFRSLFEHADIHEKIIRHIGTRSAGISRNDLLKATKIASGGTFKKRIDELIASGFIASFVPFGKRKKDFYLKVVDEYSLFYLHWIDKLNEKPLSLKNKNYWITRSQLHDFTIWSGYAFEAVCLKHINQILTALKLEGRASEISSWKYIPPKGSKEKGAQIDLLIDRIDNAITLCEIKYSNSPFTIDKQYAKQLADKIAIFEKQSKTKKQVFFSMITTEGIKKNIWSEDLISSEVTLDDLMK